MVIKWFNKENNEDNPDKPEMLLINAIAAFEEGDFEKAANIFIEIANCNQEHPLAHLLLARSLIQLGETEQAIEALLNHLDVDSESVEGLIYIGLAFFEINHIDKAEEAFEEAIKLKSNSIMARENLVIVKIEAGQHQDALEELLEMLEEYPNDKGLTELIVITFGKMGNWTAAKRYAEYDVTEANFQETSNDIW